MENSSYISISISINNLYLGSLLPRVFQLHLSLWKMMEGRGWRACSAWKNNFDLKINKNIYWILIMFKMSVFSTISYDVHVERGVYLTKITQKEEGSKHVSEDPTPLTGILYFFFIVKKVFTFFTFLFPM